MTIDTDELLSLPVEEKLKIVELLWDDIENSNTPFPLSDWIREDVKKRREDMKDPNFGLSQEELWKQVEQRNG